MAVNMVGDQSDLPPAEEVAIVVRPFSPPETYEASNGKYDHVATAPASRSKNGAPIDLSLQKRGSNGRETRLIFGQASRPHTSRAPPVKSLRTLPGGA